MIETYLIVIPFVFLAGFIDSIAGGGGLISVPAYLAAGIPPHHALANNKFSSTWGTLVSAVRYFRNGLMDLPVAALAAAGALAGSFLGTRLVLGMDPSFLNYVLIVLVPTVAVIVLLNKKMGMETQTLAVPRSVRLGVGALIGLGVGFYDGFFGPGTGMFMILLFTAALKYDFATANGNTKAANLASNISSLVTFMVFGKVQFALAIPAAVAGIAGNILGSRLVIKNGSKVVRPFFILALALLFVKIVYDLIAGAVRPA